MNTENGKCLTHCKDYPNCKPCPQIEADEYLNSKNLFDSTDGKDVITTNYTGLKAMLIDFLQRQGQKTVSEQKVLKEALLFIESLTMLAGSADRNRMIETIKKHLKQ